MLLTRFISHVSTSYSPKKALLLKNESCGPQTSHLKGVVQIGRIQVVLQIRAEVIRILKAAVNELWKGVAGGQVKELMKHSTWLLLVSVGGEPLLRTLSAHTEQSITQRKCIIFSRDSFLYTVKACYEYSGVRQWVLVSYIVHWQVSWLCAHCPKSEGTRAPNLTVPVISYSLVISRQPSFSTLQIIPWYFMLPQQKNLVVSKSRRTIYFASSPGKKIRRICSKSLTEFLESQHTSSDCSVQAMHKHQYEILT